MFRQLVRTWKTMDLPWRSQKLAGTDLIGNMYFEGPPLRAGTDRTRRIIEYFDGRTEYSEYDPTLIPPQWSAWLRHSRIDAPTLEELAAFERQRLETQRRAAEIDRAWAERKLQIEQEKRANISAEQTPQELKRPSAAPSSSSSSHTQQPPPPPPSSSSPSPGQQAPQGQGDTFAPGSWKPSAKRRS
ncbi:hypothetical protein DFS34DRAFT_615252 [Phlyctochytrium arcticum]|nr:hypothetical protein DFS34DRAFT_615252 [Phlyctochytrium arcticum]